MNEPINGLYGRVYDENGQELQGTQEFEGRIEFEKKNFKVAGQFMEKNKVTGGKGIASIKIQKLDSRLQKKVAENPGAKYNYLGKLADPTVDGEEAILFIGLSFDSVQLLNYKLGELVESDFPATFDDFKYVESME